MKALFLAAAAASALCVASPALATLQLSISANGSTFSCFDGELSCDLSGAANDLLTIDHTVGGVFVELTLALSSFGYPNELQLSSSNIVNNGGAPVTVKLLASDTSFTSPVDTVRESSSLTFNSAVGSGASMLQFWADKGNVQGANPTNHPGTLLFTATGTPTTNPDSFEGTHLSMFDGDHPFSMTEGASLKLIGGASITGFNESMQAAPVAVIPEPRTWALMAIGFALMGVIGIRRRGPRYAI